MTDVRNKFFARIKDQYYSDNQKAEGIDQNPFSVPITVSNDGQNTLYTFDREKSILVQLVRQSSLFTFECRVISSNSLAHAMNEHILVPVGFLLSGVDEKSNASKLLESGRFYLVDNIAYLKTKKYFCLKSSMGENNTNCIFSKVKAQSKAGGTLHGVYSSAKEILFVIAVCFLAFLIAMWSILKTMELSPELMLRSLCGITAGTMIWFTLRVWLFLSTDVDTDLERDEQRELQQKREEKGWENESDWGG